MSAHVLLNLLNELQKNEKMQGLNNKSKAVSSLTLSETITKLERTLNTAQENKD